MAILAILWQQELILNSTCRLSAGRCTAFLKWARNWAYHFCSGVCLYLPLVPLVSPLLCLLPILRFLFCPTEPGVWIRPYKGLEHASLCSSFSGVFFFCSRCFHLCTLLSFPHEYEYTYAAYCTIFVFPIWRATSPSGRSQAHINTLTHTDMFAVKPDQWGHLS